MRIRTQDRRNSVDMKGMIIRACTEDAIHKGHYAIIAISNVNKSQIEFLGDYTSNKKALKVLDMIEEMYQERNEWLCTNGKVFVMPEDSEVNV